MSALLNRDFLIKNLCFMYRLMVASAPLLRFASERSEGEMKKYFLRHLEEEKGHEEMVRRDLESLGVYDIPHDYTAAQLAGAQYYLIQHFHPALLLGYMSVLEGNSLTPESIEQVEKIHGQCMTAIRHHSEHDPKHIVELERMTNSLPVGLRAAVLWNAKGVKDILAAESERWLHG